MSPPSTFSPRYYWIVDSLGITVKVLGELYAERAATGLICRMETDVQPMLPEAFVRLQHKP